MSPTRWRHDILPCKVKTQYLLTLKVSRDCLLVVQSSKCLVSNQCRPHYDMITCHRHTITAETAVEWLPQPVPPVNMHYMIVSGQRCLTVGAASETLANIENSLEYLTMLAGRYKYWNPSCRFVSSIICTWDWWPWLGLVTAEPQCRPIYSPMKCEI